jgi:hypothetical protein
MQDGRVMTAVIESADLDHTPTADVLCQVHRDLPTEAGSLLVPGHAAWPELTGNR